MTTTAQKQRRVESSAKQIAELVEREKAAAAAHVALTKRRLSAEARHEWLLAMPTDEPRNDRIESADAAQKPTLSGNRIDPKP